MTWHSLTLLLPSHSLQGVPYRLQNNREGLAMSERKSAQIITRLTEDDRAWVDREAELRGLDTSSFIRMTLRQVRHARDGAERRAEVA